MAQHAVRSGKISIKLECMAFGVSHCCYRYQPRLSTENAEIADHLIRLTHNQRNTRKTNAQIDHGAAQQDASKQRSSQHHGDKQGAKQ